MTVKQLEAEPVGTVFSRVSPDDKPGELWIRHHDQTPGPLDSEYSYEVRWVKAIEPSDLWWEEESEDSDYPLQRDDKVLVWSEEDLRLMINRLLDLTNTGWKLL